jgi:hypothetical protein
MKKDEPEQRWPIRLALIAVGGLTAAEGAALIYKGYWWMALYETRIGPGYISTLWLVLAGGLAAAIGLVPWPKSWEPRRHR